jgi:hypothetical protein
MKHRSLLIGTFLMAGVPALAQIGSVARYQKITQGAGGFTGPLRAGDWLGLSVAAMGDLNGDGVGDLAAAAMQDDDGGEDRGAIWILFLNPNGTVASQAKISQTQGGFGGTLADDAYLGAGITALGDLDGDGRRELAAATLLPLSVWVLFLNPDGSVRAQREIPWSDPVFGGGTLGSDFTGWHYPRGLAGTGDLDGDGIGDLALGAAQDDDGDEDAGAVWLLYLNADGSPRAATKISQASGGLGDVLGEGSLFGLSLDWAGDLNGDGIGDLAVDEAGADVPGRLWLLFLDGNQQVIGTRTITGIELDLSVGDITVGLGEAFARVGDLDGDGGPDFAYGNGGLPPDGGFVTTFLDGSGGLRKRLIVRGGVAGLPDDPSSLYLGSSMTALGDLDGDGTPEVAAGDFRDSQAGAGKGAVWILSLSTSAVRNGSGVNPLTLSEAAEPALGVTWNATLDCSGHANGVAFLGGWDRPTSGIFLPAGELLTGSGNRLFFLVASHFGAAVPISAAVPNDLALVNLEAHLQGLCTGAPLARLSNALDVLVGK